MKTLKFARTWQMQDQLSLGKEKEINTASHILVMYCKPQAILPAKKILCLLSVSHGKHRLSTKAQRQQRIQCMCFENND